MCSNTWSPAGSSVFEGHGSFRKWITKGHGLEFYSCAPFSVCSLLLDHRPNVTSHLWPLPPRLSWDDGLYLLKLWAKINLPSLELLSVKYLVMVPRKTVQFFWWVLDQQIYSLSSLAYFLAFHGLSQLQLPGMGILWLSRAFLSSVAIGFYSFLRGGPGTSFM